MQNASTRVFGHRGAKGYLAENTLESIEKALNFNVDGIEIDVHLCASGELVVFHDFTLDRMTNGTGEVGKQTLKALKELIVNGGFQIPTLEEVLNLIDKKCLLNIELKGKNTAIKTCEIVSNYVQNRGWDDTDFIVSSFQHTELETMFQTNKNIPLAVLTKASVTEAVEFAKTIQAKIIHPNFALLTKDNVKLAQSLGFEVNTWTVNDADTILRMKQYGVNGIISDVPDKI
ncbi:glycerophosphoryl diester phosphodiesterase [Bizionia echini]|uniref:Glycerophosphoryl diester phosphodiesterase n=1 Tax=Bizionia echini TaxID=649333 RepID=A0A1I4YNS4_9FLAO|nr:glycerophosphodiester phosphodiesterase family protein [Bizionia echini]SFN39250.1 glycerophosphoryl diester phosphodiesterase [Bizionia echini]